MPPWFDGAAEARARAIRKEGAAAIPGLIEALSDPDRFVAAHVLLTEIAGVGYEPFPTWNGLVLQLFGGGRTAIDPRQRVTLEKRWRQWAAEIPHPSSLPAARE